MDSNGDFHAENYDYVMNHMTPLQIQEANAALDVAREELRRAAKAKR